MSGHLHRACPTAARGVAPHTHSLSLSLSLALRTSSGVLLLLLLLLLLLSARTLMHGRCKDDALTMLSCTAAAAHRAPQVAAGAEAEHEGASTAAVAAIPTVR